MNKRVGFFILLVSFSIFILVLFRNVIANPNAVFYSGSGDGLKGYYGATYHAKYDSTYLHLEGMNYPYGEHVYFSGNQIPLTNTVKFLKPILDLSDYMVGILNIGALLSIIIACLLLYLIFVQLKIPILMAIVAAVGITLLSPQWPRLEGHYDLAYQLVLPFIIYQLLRFHQTKSYNHSIYIFIGVFIMMNMHPYFFPLTAIFTGTYFLFYSIKGKFKFKLLLSYIPHFFLQIILPFLLFTLVLKLTSSVTDRTEMPWGFWEYNSNTSGVFYPFGKPYQFLFDLFVTKLAVSWEGVAYVGLFAIIMLILVFVYRLQKIVSLVEFKSKNDENSEFVFYLLLAGIIGMIISFAFPFNMGAEEKKWLDSFGVIKQIRGIGRMNWTFFYAVNIFAVYWLYKLTKEHKKILYGISFGLFFILFYDGYYQIKDYPTKINNPSVYFSDNKHVLKENQWINEVNIQQYQAIIPFPYFHIGSENLSASSDEELKNYVLATSVTTGIPTTGIVLSRTSLSQTFKSLQMHSEPYRELSILKDINSKKPFLIIADTSKIKDKERFWINHAKFLLNNGKYNIYEIPFSVIKNATETIKNETKFRYNLIAREDLSSINSFPFYYSDTLFVNSTLAPIELLKELSLTILEEQKISISFWMDGMETDLIPRSRVEVWHHKPNGEVYWIDYYGISDQFLLFDKEKGLLAIETYQKPKERISVYLYNNELTTPELITFDSFLVSIQGDTILSKNKGSLFINNRIY